MRRILLTLLAAGLAWGHCTSTKSGNWSDTTVWSGDCSGRSPGNGDFALIGAGHTVTIDQDIGTAAGGGIKRIDINGTGSKLQVDGAAPRTVVFGSTGSDPVGSGDASNPGENATMFGFLVGKGTLDFSNATAANYVYLTTADDTSPIYIAHAYGTLGGNGGATVRLRYTVMDRMGIDVAGFRGINIEGHASGQSTVAIDYCKFVSPFQALRATGSNFAALQFTFNTLTGLRSYGVYLGAAPSVQTVITDNTASAPAVNAYLLYAGNGLANFVYSRNVVEGSGTYTLGGLNLNAAASSITNWTIENNICISYLSSASGSKCLVLRSSANATGMTVIGVLAEGTYQAIYHVGAADASDNLTISGAISFQSAGSSAGQGVMISYGGRYTLERSIGVLDSSSSNLIWFGLGSGRTYTPTFRYNIARCAGTGTTGGSGIRVAETGYPGTNAVAHSNLLDNCYRGIADSTAANTWVAQYAGAGAHHNNAYNAAYTDSGGANFDNGTDQHPHSVYGDTAHNPHFVEPGRRLGGYDAWLGGPGTAANGVAEMGKRCGLDGAWDTRYHPADAIHWVRQGFRPRNPALATSGWDGSGPTWAGPDQPILMFGVVNQ